MISNVVTRSETSYKRLDVTVKLDRADIVNKFVGIFWASSGKHWMQKIEGGAQLKIGALDILPKVQCVGRRTL